jgi:hypothetical protein
MEFFKGNKEIICHSKVINEWKGDVVFSGVYLGTFNEFGEYKVVKLECS